LDSLTLITAPRFLNIPLISETIPSNPFSKHSCKASSKEFLLKKENWWTKEHRIQKERVKIVDEQIKEKQDFILVC
jgi:hypothetical protein